MQALTNSLAAAGDPHLAAAVAPLAGSASLPAQALPALLWQLPALVRWFFWRDWGSIEALSLVLAAVAAVACRVWRLQVRVCGQDAGTARQAALRRPRHTWQPAPGRLAACLMVRDGKTRSAVTGLRRTQPRKRCVA